MDPPIAPSTALQHSQNSSQLLVVSHYAREWHPHLVHRPHWHSATVIPRFCYIPQAQAQCEPDFQSLLALIQVHHWQLTYATLDAHGVDNSGLG